MDGKGLVGGQLHLLSLLIPGRVESKRHDGEETFEVLKRLDEPATPLSLEMELKSELAEWRFLTAYDDCMMINHWIGAPNFQNISTMVFHIFHHYLSEALVIMLLAVAFLASCAEHSEKCKGQVL